MAPMNRRNFLKTSALTGAALALPMRHVLGANERVNVGMIGMGGMGRRHLGRLQQMKNVNVIAAADPDASRVGDRSGIKTYVDFRKMLEDKDLDAVVIATSNQWHVPAAILACQAGKDVYVEKPFSHTQYEGEQLIQAIAQYKRICQVGTQQRSDPCQALIKKDLDEGLIGKIDHVHACRLGMRKSIGKRSTPLPIPKSVNYDLWLGPAMDVPLFRDRLQYDWHWDWNTGNGEMGNWGIHMLDDVCNNVFRDKCPIPKRILVGGGRVAWNDAGETPNVMFIYIDTGAEPVIFDLSNLAMSPKRRISPHYKGIRSGYVIEGEKGYYAGGRGGGAFYGKDRKRIKTCKGNGGGGHMENFLQAVKSRDAKSLNAPVDVAYGSTSWCNLTNIAYKLGHKFSREQALEINKTSKPWATMLDKAKQHLAAWNIDITSPEIKLSPILELDPKTKKFIGPHAKTANPLLTKKYRKGYELPKIG